MICLFCEPLLGYIRKEKIELLSRLVLKLLYILLGMPLPWNKQRVGLFRP